MLKWIRKLNGPNASKYVLVIRMKIITTKYNWFKIINNGFFPLKLQVILRADPFLKLLHDFSSLGSAMRTVMTKCLIDPMTYQRYVNINMNFDYCTL